MGVEIPVEQAPAEGVSEWLTPRPRRTVCTRPAARSAVACSEADVNNLLTKVAAANNAATRNSYTSQIDMQVMKDAGILPEVYAKSLLYRSPNLTNVYVQSYYDMYNYAVLGLK